MAYSHASTARSPSRSPTRRAPTRTASRRAPSTTSTQYELDLDAFGASDSTGLETTDNGNNDLGNLEVVRSDDIEGPEDFTLNMEYWMKTPLPLLPKEPVIMVEEATEELEDATGDGDRAISNVYNEQGEEEIDPQSPTTHTPETRGEGEGPTDLAESTMEHEEKVMSYLDALPDTDVADAAASTPHYKAGTLRRQRPHESQPPFAQSPSRASPKTRSLQPTVEDSTDTPRKITQETVIHYQTDEERQSTNESIFRDIAELESQLKEQESAAQARITELETIISFTRSELEASRNQSYKQSEDIKELEELNEMLELSVKASSADTNKRLEAQREESQKRMHDLNSEHVKETARQVEAVNEAWQLRLKEETEKYAKVKDEEWNCKEKSLRSQYEDQLKALGVEKEHISKTLLTRDEQIIELRQELGRSKGETSHHLAKVVEEQKAQFDQERVELNEKITTLGSRIENLILELKSATEDATKTRIEANDYATLKESSKSQIIDIMDLESRLRSVQTQLDSSRLDVTTKNQEILRGIAEQERMEIRLNDSQTRISDLENTISILRQDLAQSRAETDDARKEIQRAHEGTRVVRESLREARAETELKAHEFEERLNTLEVANKDISRMLENAHTERHSLVSSHKSQLAEMRTKAEDAVRKVGVMLETERMEKKKLTKETKALKAELDQLRAEAHDKKAGSEEPSSEAGDADGVYSTEAVSELEMLREIIRKQAATNKAVKAEAQAARTELECMRAEMEAQKEEFEDVNRAMNERFATLLKPLMKEKTKSAMENRDGKWLESVGKIQVERDFMGRVLMREWGKQECGRAKNEEAQVYRYHFPRN